MGTGGLTLFPGKTKSWPHWNIRSVTAIWTGWQHFAGTKEPCKQEMAELLGNGGVMITIAGK